MRRNLAKDLAWLFGPDTARHPGRLWPRWLWLRALAVIFFSAFYSWFFQVRGLIGPNGILPAGAYLREVAEQLGARRFLLIPSLLWIASGDRALLILCGVGLAASLLLALNVWPRGMLALCVVAFLSLVSAAQDFSSYQSDGMLLAAGFLSLFFAPPGLRPGLGERHPPSRASLFLLQWLWFQIYFESGVVKWASQDPEWRHLTALDHYYENGPLPDWIGWYAQQLPHGFQAAVTLATLAIEIGVVWMLFLPRRYRRICFLIVTPFQIGIILTANLAFLNYLVLSLGVLLLDDEFLCSLRKRVRRHRREAPELARLSGTSRDATPAPPASLPPAGDLISKPVPEGGVGSGDLTSPQVPGSGAGGGDLVSLRIPEGRAQRGESEFSPPLPPPSRPGRSSSIASFVSLTIPALFLSWIFYNTTAQMLLMFFPELPLPAAPIEALEPFRISDRYGLFAVMTTARYEIEFQGSRDGANWIAYPFRYKPQNPYRHPGIQAPYQPRFDWNLWFASLGDWHEYPFVVNTEARLLQNSPSVLALFAGNPFGTNPPRLVRAVKWQYWFTDLAAKRKNGLWWRREYLGLYAPTLEREPGGKIEVTQMPDGNNPQ